ncbi:biopolymer transporter ExbD [Pontiellaceae bacterium B12219]|nr:biopolymer transporter ExbD [Pontiellaceae bacterium B12219]
MKLAGVMESTDLKMQMASLIDVVFLMLIYFMVTASLIRKEADISFLIPLPDEILLTEVPIEALIEVKPDGTVELDGMRFSGADRMLEELSAQISGLRQIATSQGSAFHVTLLPHQETLHYRIIDVMDACAESGVERLGFANSL